MADAVNIRWLFVTERNRLGLTQEQVAQALRVSRPSIANIEAGKQTPSLKAVGHFIRFFKPNPELLARCLIASDDSDEPARLTAPAEEG